MTRLCLPSAGRAIGRAEILLLPGWGGRSAQPARAAPVPVPLAPASIPNRAEGLPPALGRAEPPPLLCLSSPAAPRPLSAHTETVTGSSRGVVADAWAALGGHGCQVERDTGESCGEAQGHPVGTGTAGLASRWCFPRDAQGPVRGVGGSGASGCHRSSFSHVFVREREEFPRPAGAGALPRGGERLLELPHVAQRVGESPRGVQRSPQRGGTLGLVCESGGSSAPNVGGPWVPELCPQSRVPGESCLAAQRHRRFM